MDPVTRAALVVLIEDQYRSTLKEQVAAHAQDPEEQHQIASSVVALLLRKMYLDLGPLWLEMVLKMVLQPPDQIAGPPVARPFSRSTS
jgi:hypothetical protein